MEGLRDIKEIVEVHDDSLLLLIATVIIILLLMVLIGYVMRRKRHKRRQRPTPQMIAKQALQSIDYDDAKSAAYVFSEHASRFVTEDSYESHQKIIEALTPYKYKKEVPPLERETAQAMKAYIKKILWSR